MDAIPPKAVAVYPQPGALKVPRDAVPAVQFSEWIDRSTGRGQVIISPPLPGKIKTEVDGDRLLIHLPRKSGGLRPNTPYRVTVRASLKDLHGVSMGNPVSFTFTTGESFDSGRVTGRVFVPDAKAPALAALYRMGQRDAGSVLPRMLLEQEVFRPDSLPNPWSELPAFVSQADSTGAFAFDSITQGDYALLAFQDINGNLLPDFGFEPVGIGPGDLQLSPRAANQSLALSLLDTTGVHAGQADTNWTLVFVDPSDASGKFRKRQNDLLPGSEYRLRSSLSLNAERWSLLQEHLEARKDTVPVGLEIKALDSTDFSLHLANPLHMGQSLRLRLKTGDTTFRVLASVKALDSLHLGGLKFQVPDVWQRWMFVLQTVPPSGEQVLKPIGNAVAVDALASGTYRLSAFLDRNEDGTWNPGTLRPWVPQEPWSVALDSIEVLPGTAVDLTSRLSDKKP